MSQQADEVRYHSEGKCRGDLLKMLTLQFPDTRDPARAAPRAPPTHSVCCALTPSHAVCQTPYLHILEIPEGIENGGASKKMVTENVGE